MKPRLITFLLVIFSVIILAVSIYLTLRLKPGDATPKKSQAASSISRIWAQYISSDGNYVIQSGCDAIYGSNSVSLSNCDPNEPVNISQYMPNGAGISWENAFTYTYNGQLKIVITYILNDKVTWFQNTCDISFVPTGPNLTNCSNRSFDLRTYNFGSNKYLSMSYMLVDVGNKQKISAQLYGENGQDVWLLYCDFIPGPTTYDAQNCGNWIHLNLSTLRGPGNESYRGQQNITYYYGPQQKIMQSWLGSNGYDSWTRVCDINPDDTDLHAANCTNLQDQYYDLRQNGQGSFLSVNSIPYALNYSYTPGFVRINGERFSLGGQPYFMYGINYTPAFINMPEYKITPAPGRSIQSIFSSPNYQQTREYMKKELRDLASLGYNTISVGSYFFENLQDNSSSNIQDFFALLKSYGLRAIIYVPYCDPTVAPGTLETFSINNCKQMISSLGLQNEDALIAYDIAWEANLKAQDPYHLMQHLNADWQKWILDRYGTFENAYTKWGYSDNSLPTNAQMLQSGPWDKKIAAFNRFYQDFVSKYIFDIATAIKQVDPNHYLTARAFGGNPNYMYTTGVARGLDFIGWEIYANASEILNTNNPDYSLANGIQIELIRSLSPGKPIILLEYGGPGVTTNCTTCYNTTTPELLAAQKQIHSITLQTVLQNNLSGAFAWSYAEQRPWYFSSTGDSLSGSFGIRDVGQNLNTNLGKPRPAYFVQKNMAESVKSHSPTPTYNSTITYDINSKAQNLQFQESFLNTYLSQRKSGLWPQLLPNWTGTDSRTAPNICVGNIPNDQTCPHTSLNAQFESLEILNSANQWQNILSNPNVSVPYNQPVPMRGSVRNVGFVPWQTAATYPDGTGVVKLATRSSVDIRSAITQITPPNSLTSVPQFNLPALTNSTSITFEMVSEMISWFGEKVTVNFITSSPPIPTNTPIPTSTPQPSPTSAPQASIVSALNSVCSPTGTSATLGWNPGANNTQWHVRVDDENGVVDSATEWGNTPNNCGNNSHDICINDWNSPDMVIRIIPGRQYLWWIHGANQWTYSAPVYGTRFTCLAPTNTPQPTPTNTPRPTPTNTPSNTPTPSSTPVPTINPVYDANGNGVVDIADVVFIFTHYLTSTSSSDINKDNVTNIWDMIKTLKAISVNK